MRVVSIILLALGLAFASTASAQPAEPPPPPGKIIKLNGAPAVVRAKTESRGGVTVPSTPAVTDTKFSTHDDIAQGNSKAMAILFWLFALAAVGGALFVVTRRNLIAAVMGMVGSFLAIAATYMLLYANFLAVVQLLVYAGAIMVLFVFVVMILNRPEDEPVAPTGKAGQALGGVAILYLIGRLVMILINVRPPPQVLHVAMNAPAPTKDGHAWGSVAAVGTDLFGPGLFPFEAISILLLVAVVGAIAIARPLHEIEAPEGTDPNDPRVEGHSV